MLAVTTTRLLAVRPAVVSRCFSSTSSACQESWDDADSTTYRTYPAVAPRRTAPKQRPKMDRTPLVQPPTRPEELARQALRRVQRAERLERKDLTAQLTETKTYMGGFTQPRHLAFLNPLDKTRKVKDSYEVRVGDSRVRPEAVAYEPHVVYLATTRYPVRWGHGRATRRECFSGFCKESELVDRFKDLNGWRMSEPGVYKVDNASREYTELAVWPGSPEARSLANKFRTMHAKALMKDEALANGVVDVPGVKKQKVKLDVDLLPPVTGFVRPLPPFDEPTLIFPLMTVTLPTRPLASTLSRLCNAFPRGLPFYASVPNADRKDGPSFFRRLLRMRADRIRELTSTIVDRLEGNGGGFFGLRLNPDDKGRGVEGENLSEALVRPERGWAVVRWLEDDSEGWKGLERETLQSDWVDMHGVRLEGAWTEFATPVGEPIEKWVRQYPESDEDEVEPVKVEPFVAAPKPFIILDKSAQMDRSQMGL